MQSGRVRWPKPVRKLLQSAAGMKKMNYYSGLWRIEGFQEE